MVCGLFGLADQQFLYVFPAALYPNPPMFGRMPYPSPEFFHHAAPACRRLSAGTNKKERIMTAAST
jgi:hypothetical protein